MSGSTQSQASNPSTSNSTAQPIESVLSLQPDTDSHKSQFNTYHTYPARGGGKGLLVFKIKTISGTQDDGRSYTRLERTTLDGKRVTGSKLNELLLSAAEENEEAMRDHREKYALQCLDDTKTYWE